MRRWIALIALSTLLTACGNRTPAATPSATTGTASGSTAVTTPASNATPTTAASDATKQPTADEATETTDSTPESSDNTSFAGAITLGDKALKVNNAGSDHYYKLTIPKGGVITATLEVASGSNGPGRITLYDQLQNYVADISVPVGESKDIGYIYSSGNGGTVFVGISGNFAGSLKAQGSAQNDGGTNGDAVEDLQKAPKVPLGQINGLLGGGDRTDIYSVDLPTSGGVLDISLQSSNNAHLTVYDENDSYVADIRASDNKGATLQHVLVSGSGGKWSLGLEGEGSYSMNVAFAKQDDAKVGGDAGDDVDHAARIPLGSFEGLLGDPDNADTYAFELPKTGGLISITFNPADGSEIKATLTNNDKSYVTDVGVTGPEAGSLGFLIPRNSGGRWYVAFNGTGAYTFSVNFEPQQDAGSDGDAGEELPSALAVSTATFSGMSGNNDEKDVYRIKASLGKHIKVAPVQGEGNIDVTVSDLNGSYITNGGATPNDGVELESTTEGDYLLTVSSGGSPIMYTITIEP